MRRRGSWLAISVTLALGACTIPTGYSVTPSPTSAAGYRAIWDSSRPSDYSFVVQRTCFCAFVDPLHVTVEGDRVTALTSDGKPIRPGNPELAAIPLTVDGLFDYAEQAEQRAAHSRIGYDPALGYPTHMEIDWDATSVDDDVTIEVRDFRALP
jgi:hypothetical protein